MQFPSRIEIIRPKEEYDITLTIVKLDINLELKDDQFMLEIPAGTETVHLDQPKNQPPKSGPSAIGRHEGATAAATPAP
jgi:hypothetical protein